MFAVVINEKGGQPRRQEFNKSEVTIGRVQGNDIILPKQNVSKRHSRVVVKDGKFIIVDLKSTNGTYVNGRKIASPMVIKPSDKIYIGDFILSVENIDEAIDAADSPMSAPAPAVAAAAPISEPLPQIEPPRAKPAPPPPPRPKPVPAAPTPIAATPAPVPAAPIRPEPVQARPLPPPPAPAPAPLPARPAPAPVAPARPAPAPKLVPAEVATPAPMAQISMPIGDGGGELGPVMVELHEQLSEFLDRHDLRSPSAYLPGQPVDEGTWHRAEGAVRDALRSIEASGRLPTGADPAAIASTVVSEALALGPITALLDDAGVQRILVNGAQRIYATRNGRTEPVPARFSGNLQVVQVADRLLRAAGVHAAAGSQFVEAYLPDGARVHVALPHVGGPFVTIERPSVAGGDLAALVDRDVLSRNMAGFLELTVRAGRRVVVAGNDTDTRAELIDAMLGSGAAGLRVVAVEGSGRLGNAHGHLVTLTSAPGADPATLVQNAVKMRPDRLVVVDCRGPEAFHALSALLGGVDGGILGIAADSPDDAVLRLVRLAGLALHASDDRVEQLVREAADVLVHVVRYADGRARVARIIDLDGGEMQEIFSGLGVFRATGHVPRFVGEAQNLGHTVDANLFR